MKSPVAAVLALSLASLFFSGCATVYTAPDFTQYQAQHREVAILPFQVHIDPSNRAEVEAAELEQQSLDQSSSLQRAMYTQFLQGQQRGKYTVDFQDIDETNTLLRRVTSNQAPLEAISALTKSEICDALQVDAVISGNVQLAKPMGTGAAIASAFLLGVQGATNEATVNMSVHEGQDGYLLWNYEYDASGGLFSSPDRLAKALISSAAKSFPYRAK